MEQLSEQNFINEIPDFYNFMIDSKFFKSTQTYRDYITRLKYVSRLFKLDKSLTQERIAEIAEYLKKTTSERERYNTISGVRDIVSGLNKFLLYVNSDYKKKLDDSIIKEEKSILNNATLDVTEKEALIKSRIGQGLFRRKLLAYWKGCAVTQCQTFPLLTASHIMPWRKSDNTQRLDVFNGLLLTPNLDKLFDLGYISFNKTGKIICSEFLSESDYKILGINSSLSLCRVEERHQPYLKYHRENCLL